MIIKTIKCQLIFFNSSVLGDKRRKAEILNINMCHVQCKSMYGITHKHANINCFVELK